MSTMNCAEFEQLLEDAAERRAAVDNDLLDPHVTHCASCRTLWEQSRLLDQSIAAWQAAVPEADLTDAVLARWAFGKADDIADSDDISSDFASTQIAENKPQPVPRATKPWRTLGRQLTTGLMAVATVVILINSWQRFETWNQSRTNPEPESSIIVQAPIIPSIPDESDADAGTLLRNASSAYRVLAVDAATAVADASKLVVATNRLTPPQTADVAALDKHADVPDNNTWDRDLKPIGKQFGEALDFLFEVAPEPPPSI